MVGVKTGLPPITRADARLFILGSLPGDASIAAGQYYAHPTNQFWRLIGAAIGEELQTLDYEQRLERLAANGIGLWDVVASARRRGSLDQAIRLPRHNMLDRLLHDHPRLEALAFNGATASRMGRSLLGNDHGLTLVDLPSSSAANTRAFYEKAEAWRELSRFCGRAALSRA